MSSSLSLTIRAVLAVGLLITFYVLALAITGGLLFIPYAMVVYGHRVYFRVALFCVIGAVVILWSILPRPDRFIPPGPRLKPDEQSRLSEVVHNVAKATGQQMPVDVYLVPDINAWVTNRGGMMGFGSRRVMGIGLPLLQLLTISQLRAVLVHEFGHYQGGDTRLGPWIYKTRTAIGRTIAGLAEHSSLLRLPFLWYGKLFLRITHAVSRQQEFAADRLAARITGPGAMIDGLRMIAGSTVAFQVYWQNEVAPVLSAGFQPPLAAGFGHFMAAAPTADLISKVTEQEMSSRKADPYDTHPPLSERIAAIENLLTGEQPEQDLPAISLIDNIPDLERHLLLQFATRLQVNALKPVQWEEVGAQVYLPMWEEFARQYRSQLGEATPYSMPELSRHLAELSRKAKPGLSPKTHQKQAGRVLGAALAVALHKQGWTLHALPGDEFCFQRGEVTINPFEATHQLASGAVSVGEWQQQCATAGLPKEPLLRLMIS